MTSSMASPEKIGKAVSAVSFRMIQEMMDRGPDVVQDQRELCGRGQRIIKGNDPVSCLSQKAEMVCVGIYAVLVGSMIVADNLHSAIFSLAAYTVILCFSLFKTGALAKSIFNAH